MKNLFPFSQVRETQSELLNETREILKNNENLIAHAPTGIGKTAAVLPPSLSYALENSKNIFFLTPRHSQHSIAIETLKKVKKKFDVNFSVADLIGKKWLCPMDDLEQMSSSDFQDYCKTLKSEERCSYYNNTVNKDDSSLTDEALKALRKCKDNIMHAEEIKNLCSNLCPYEILMNLVKSSQVVIADYYHIFHPSVRDVMFSKAGVNLEDSILIVDEAHNLPDRTRSLFSSKLSSFQLNRAEKEASKFGFYQAKEKLERLSDLIEKLAKEKTDGKNEAHLEKKDLNESISNFAEYQDFIVDLEGIAEEVREEKDRSYCGGIAKFLENWDGEDDGYTRIIRRGKSKGGKRYVNVVYRCLNPQISTKKPLNESSSSILMSGTLTPQEMYLDLLGMDVSRTRTSSYESPFPKENKLNLIVDKVTTRYKERDETQFKKIAWFLKKSIGKVPGNVGVFFPSYKLRDKISEFLKGKINKKLIFERRNLSKEEKKELFDQFASYKDNRGAALLGVVRGSYSEGVDYPGDIMKGVFIVGLPLKKPDLVTKALIDFYDYKFGKGWEYGYSYPAVNRAVQAAGRCIRSKEDKGVVVFLEERYLWGNYRKVLPPNDSYGRTKTPWKEIERFFNR